MPSMWFTKQPSGYRAQFSLKLGTGYIATGVSPGSFTVTVVDPTDTAVLTPSVAESSVKAGLYYFTITSAFITTNGVGEYGVVVEVLSSPTPKIADTFSAVLRVTQKDFDDAVAGAVDLTPGAVADVADGVWDEAVVTHQTAGTFGRNTTLYADETTSTAGSTTTTIRTGLTQADGFYDNMQVVVVNAAGTVVRNIDAFRNLNGEIDVGTLPFTPAISDPVLILRRTGSVPVDAGSIAEAVWDEPVASHQTAGTFGRNATVYAVETTAAVGSTATTIRTGLTEADNFYNNMQVVIVNSAGVVARSISAYRQTNGEIDVSALPFTPAVSDPVLIVRRTTSSGSADPLAISAAVWSTLLPGTFLATQAGGQLNAIYAQQVSLSSTVAAGSTDSIVNTAVVAPDTYYRGMFLQITHAGAAVTRVINENISGAFYVVDPFPFTPTIGDKAIVIGIFHTSELGEI